MLAGKLQAAIRPRKIFANLDNSHLIQKQGKILCKSEPQWGLRSFR